MQLLDVFSLRHFNQYEISMKKHRATLSQFSSFLFGNILVLINLYTLGDYRYQLYQLHIVKNALDENLRKKR